MSSTTSRCSTTRNAATLMQTVFLRYRSNSKVTLVYVTLKTPCPFLGFQLCIERWLWVTTLADYPGLPTAFTFSTTCHALISLDKRWTNCLKPAPDKDFVPGILRRLRHADVPDAGGRDLARRTARGPAPGAGAFALSPLSSPRMLGPMDSRFRGNDVPYSPPFISFPSFFIISRA